MSADVPADEVALDARGWLCPRPVLELARIARRHPGAVIVVLADDPAAETDIPAWCEMRDAELLDRVTAADHTAYRVRVASASEGSR